MIYIRSKFNLICGLKLDNEQYLLNKIKIEITIYLNVAHTT